MAQVYLYQRELKLLKKKLIEEAAELILDDVSYIDHTL